MSSVTAFQNGNSGFAIQLNNFRNLIIANLLNTYFQLYYIFELFHYIFDKDSSWLHISQLQKVLPIILAKIENNKLLDFLLELQTVFLHQNRIRCQIIKLFDYIMSICTGLLQLHEAIDPMVLYYAFYPFQHYIFQLSLHHGLFMLLIFIFQLVRTHFIEAKLPWFWSFSEVKLLSWWYLLHG